ncbi:hypothetical protein PG993_010705 [Apiospora rasikravindrae]|uniref:Uncharacterized protein n=1 Tax=Apiospora rasikravindrae TaxID=990691 RepID=A0ABR1SDW8_9PEZI
MVLQVFGRPTRINQQGDVIWIASTMPRAIYEKFEVSCWGKYVIQFASEATVGNVIMSEINRVRLGQPFGRFFSQNETGCQAIAIAIACVERHGPPGAQRGRRGAARVRLAPAQPHSLIGSVFPSPPKHQCRGRRVCLHAPGQRPRLQSDGRLLGIAESQ